MLSTLSVKDIARILGGEIRGSAELQVNGVSKDTRTLKSDDLYVALVGENFDGHQFVNYAQQAGASAALVEKYTENCSITQIKVENTLIALGELSGWIRDQFTGPVVAITGSAGKTTTKQLIYSVLSQHFNTWMTQGNLNNHIGAPLTVLNLQPEHQAAVVELGASGLGEIAYTAKWVKPLIGVITNAAAAHIAGFGSLLGVVQTKGELLDFIAPNGTAILNADDEFFNVWVARAQQDSNKKIISFGLAEHADVKASHVHCDLTGSYFTLHYQSRSYEIKLPLLGEHNVRNALAAFAVGAVLNMPVAEIIQGLTQAATVQGRLEQLIGTQGQIILNDAYNANPASVKAAIDVLKTAQSSWLVLGDMAELGEQERAQHSSVGVYAKQQKIQHLLATGTLSKNTTDAFGAGAQWFANKAELALFLTQQTRANDVILVKGSRSAGMDEVVTALLKQY